MILALQVTQTHFRLEEKGRQEGTLEAVPAKITHIHHFHIRLCGQNVSRWQHWAKREVEKHRPFLLPKKTICLTKNWGSDIKEFRENMP